MRGRFRLIKATLSVCLSTRGAQSIPAGAIIEIPSAPAEGNRTVDVLWDGRAMMMFVADLRERAVPVDKASGAPDPLHS